MSQAIPTATPAHLRAKDVMSPAAPPPILHKPDVVPALAQAPMPAPAPQVLQQAPNGPQAQPSSLMTWLQANWLMCIVIVCVMLLIFVVGWVFFRTPAPAKPAKAGPGPPQQAQAQAQPHAGVVHQAQPDNVDANAQQADAAKPQAEQAEQAQKPAQALDFNALLQRGQAAIAQTKPVQPDETSEEEILRLMQAEAPTTPAKDEDPKIETVDEKKL
jgi:hypothetical protein